MGVSIRKWLSKKIPSVLRYKQRIADLELILIAEIAAHTETKRHLAEAQKAAQWQKITPENLPVEGEEVLHVNGSVEHFVAANLDIMEEWDADDYQEWNWLWKRPINPPAQEE